MSFFVLFAVFVILGVIGVVAGKVAHTNDPTGAGHLWGLGSGVAALLAVILLTVFSSFHIVDNGYAGVTKTFGSLSGTTGNGLVTTAPWQSLEKVSVQDITREYVMDERPNANYPHTQGIDQIFGSSAVSKDSQPIYLDIVVRQQLNRGYIVPLYKLTAGQHVVRILDPAIFQHAKEVTARYKAIEFAKNRELIRNQMELAISKEPVSIVIDGVKKTIPLGDILTIKSVSLKSVDFTDSLSHAIEQTVEAEQQAKREEARVRIASAQADQRVATARGIAQSNIIEAEAQAKANHLKSSTLTPLLVQQSAIDKLNGNVKVIFTDGKSLPVFNLSGAEATGAKK